MKKNQVLVSSLFFLCIGYASSLNANIFPDEYSDFFEKKEESVTAIIQGAARSISIKALVNFESFELVNESTKQITDYLHNQNVSDEAILDIIAELKAGVIANPNCAGDLKDCIPNDEPGKAEFIFDYDAQVLRIFIATDMLANRAVKKEYHSVKQNDVGLVNQSDLNLYASNYHQNINWNNDTLIGLPFGYVDINTIFRFDNDKPELELTKALYNYEYNNFKFLVGYQDNNYANLNTTDFLVSGVHPSGLFASIGSSYNLLKGSLQAQQRLNFYVPQGGRLEVYRNERLVLARTVAAGEQSIGYNELPAGTYNIRLIVKQSDENILFENNYLIVNHSGFSLPVGQWDHRFDLGQLESLENNDPYFNVEDQYYFRSLFSYRASQSALVAAGLVTNAEDMQLLLGTELFLPYDINLSYHLGIFNTGDLYHSGFLSIAPFRLSLRGLRHNNLSTLTPLTQALYGKENFDEINLSVYTDWLIGRTSLNYSYLASEGRFTEYTSNSLSLSWGYPLFGGDFSINISGKSYSHSNDELSTSISWNRSFADSHYLRTALDFDEEGYSKSSASHIYNYDFEKISASSVVNVEHSELRGVAANASVSANGHNDKVNYDVYAFASTEDTYSVSGSLSSTQMLSKQGGAVTSKKGDAFVEIEAQWEESSQKIGNKELSFDLTSNGRSLPPALVTDKKSSLVPIKKYKEITYSLDKGFSQVDAKNANGHFFSTPGHYRKVKSKIVPLVSQLFLFNDKKGNAIEEVNCIGEGCRAIDEVTEDGVFRVSFLQGQQFELVSNDLVCEYDEKDLGKDYIVSICGSRLEKSNLIAKAKAAAAAASKAKMSADKPKLAQNTNKTPKPETGKRTTMLLIGRYYENKVDDIMSRLTKANFTAKSVKRAGSYSVYVKHQSSFSIAQIELLKGLNDSIALNKLNPNLIFLMGN